MTRLAVLGAGGFVGSRLLELSLARPEINAIPMLRQPRGLGKLARFGLAWRPIDTNSIHALAESLRGFDAVVNLTQGDNQRLLPDVQNLYEACRKAEVGRFIHLGSAVVFGEVKQRDLPDDRLASECRWSAYACAKASADAWLAGRLDTSGPATCIFRPGLVWGPRSIWVTLPVGQIIEGNAFLFHGGSGICNLCHVDRLANAILSAATRPTAVTGFYHLGDPEVRTWRQYYSDLAQEIGSDISAIHQLPDFEYTWKHRVLGLKDLEWVRQLKRRIRNQTKDQMKRILRTTIARMSPPSSGASFPASPRPDRLLWSLQSIQHPLPLQRFQAHFPEVTEPNYETAMGRLGNWLRYSGFTVEPGEFR